MTPTEPEISALYGQYAPVVFHRARSILGNDEQAQDAVQETFARVIRNWETFRGEASPLTWMSRITTNWCLNQLRNRRTHDEKHVHSRADIIGDGMCWQRDDLEAHTVRQLLADTDAETRRIVLHVYFDDMTREQTAELVGRSVPTVRKRIDQFMRRARRVLESGPVRGAAAVAVLLTLAHLLTSGGVP